MQAYRWTAERVLRELNSAPGGLSRKQAAARLAKHGENRLARKKGDSLWRRFMLQLSDPMILVLLAAAAVSAVLCVVHREFPADVLIIMTVVTVNAVLGVVQESKAEKAIAALQEMTPATSRVLRGGAECTVPSRTLVPGDVVLLSAGDRIPADCRVLESIGLRVEESALTGESQPVEKSAAPLPDDGQALPPSACSNLVFMGANVVYGRGRAVVIATGMDTQMGRIAHALNTAGQNATPLQKKLTQLSKILSLLVLAICAGIFALDVGRSLLAGGLTFLEFNYMLLQAYDFLHLFRTKGAILEMGGDDQWSNILAGADLIRRVEGKDAFAMTFTLLTNADGTKMGKTRAGALWLDANKTSPYDFYQYWRNVDDADVIKCMKLLTFLPLEEIQEMEKWEGSQLNKAKEILAFQLTELVHGTEEAKKAEAGAKALFAGGADTEHMPTTELAAEDFDEEGNIDLISLLVKSALVTTRSEGRRAIEQGGVSVDGEKVTDIRHVLSKDALTGDGIVLKRGKKKFNKVFVK